MQAVLGCEDNIICITRFDNGEMIHKIKLPKEIKGYVNDTRDHICSVCVTPDSEHVVSGSDDGIIYIIRIENGKLIRKITDGLLGPVQVRVTLTVSMWCPDYTNKIPCLCLNLKMIRWLA